MQKSTEKPPFIYYIPICVEKLASFFFIYIYKLVLSFNIHVVIFNRVI